MTKKQLILKAFEDLDAHMLDVLLNDGQSYQDVHKETFVAELKTYFSDLRNDRDYKTDFKAVQGMCTRCNKGKKGYAFVNSDGESFMSMLFEETEDDFSDIYKCSHFKTIATEIKEEWQGIYFYDDDRADYIPTELNIREQKECDRAVLVLKDEIEKEGILSRDFYIPWIKAYGHLDTLADFFTFKSYRYKNEVSFYIGILWPRTDSLKKNDLAQQYWHEFISFPVITRDVIQDWLIRCDYDFPYYKYGFEYQTDFRQGYFDIRGVKINLSEYYYLHSISIILEKYSNWIPQSNPLKENEEPDDHYEGADVFPF